MLNIGNYHIKENNAEDYTKLPFPTDREYGGIIQLGETFKKFQINLAYHRHFHKEDSSRKGFSSILQLSVGYLIEVSSGKR